MASGKVCTKCGEAKPLDAFHRNKKAKDGRQSHCASCGRRRSRDYNREHRKERREYARLFYQENPGKMRERNRRQHDERRERRIEAARRWRMQNVRYSRMQSRARHKSLTTTSSALAVNSGHPYSPDEDVFLLTDNGMNLYQKAVTLGRTYNSCRNRLARLRSREVVDV